MIKIIKVLLVLLTVSVYAQDTLTVMSYNLLQYGGSGIGCTPRSTLEKNAFITTIVNHYKPDVICLNEIGIGQIYLDNLRDYALNDNGIGTWKVGAFSNQANASDIVDGLAYNSKKLTLYSQKVSNTSVRDIVHYKMYYNDPKLSTSKDTTFITFIIAHLKASNTPTDASSRENMVNNAMNYLNNTTPANTKANYVFAGDLNLYTSSEKAYQNLINPAKTNLRFNDPVNKPGVWSNNSDFALYHTQSPRITNQGDCGATSGMDDRFDFILLSDDIMNGDKRIKYVENTYITCGQDGKRFDGDLFTPANSSAPSAVINALYANSDHLPVLSKLAISSLITSEETIGDNHVEPFYISNPFNDEIKMPYGWSKLTIINNTGSTVLKLQPEGGELVNVMSLPPGIYSIVLSNDTSQMIKKLIKLSH